MNEIQKVFDYGDKQVRTVVIEGQPWFVAKDVCEVLGLSKHDTALSRLNDSQKGSHTVGTLGGNQLMSVVNEAGLYKLIFTSRKPEAEKFSDWVAEEVLPTIRQTGQFGTRELSQLEIAQISINKLVEQERQLKAHGQALQVHESRLDQIENKIEKKMTDDFSMQLVTPTQIGKMFEPALSAKQVNQLLRQVGLQWRVGGEWVATVDGKKYSSSEPVQLDHGKMTYQLKWQRRVKDLIMGI